MSWQRQVLEKYGHQLKLELRPDGVRQILVVLPKIPPPEIIHDIRGLIPYQVKFSEEIKFGTLTKIGYLFACVGCDVTDVANNKTRQIKFTLTSLKGEFNQEELWDSVSKEIMEDGFYDSWEFELAGETIKRSRVMAQAMAGHKVSGVGLDQTDLRIALEVSQDVNDFLAMLEGKKFHHRRS